MAADVKIDIAAEFTGKKAFKQAETATDKMSKNVKKLAGALGLAFGGQQLLAFGKASVKAAADQKAQQQLALALKNVGLGRDAATSEAYIQRLQSEFGIVDDKLRPSYQTLAIATRDSAEAQRLMNIALDISAANSLDLGAVTKALSRGYLGNTAALSRLQVGISKADLKTKSFKEITDQLSTTFAGSATTAANSYQGSMDKLAVATENFKESIGVGLIEALNILNGEEGLAKTTSEIDKLGIKLQNATIGAAYFVDEFKRIPVIGSFLSDLFGKTIGDPLGIVTLIDAFEKLKQQPRPFSTGMSISGQVQIKQQAQITKLTKEQAVAQSKITKDKKLQAAIDKANLALNKGSEVFDMDKIQIAAALTSQAEALGKATTDTQRLQVANDVARLNVKQSILALEDAIAAKDEAAIVAATNKLNADLKVLGALSGQSVKLSDIKSILESLKPKDLINLTNLDAALAKIREMLGLLAQANAASGAKIPTSASLGSGIPKGDYIAPISTTGGSIGAILEYADAATERANAFAMLQEQQNYADYLSLIDYQRIVGDLGGYSRDMNRGGSQTPVVNVYANTIANPDELTNLIQNSLIQLNRRGDSLVQAGSL